MVGTVYVVKDVSLFVLFVCRVLNVYTIVLTVETEFVNGNVVCCIYTFQGIFFVNICVKMTFSVRSRMYLL